MMLTFYVALYQICLAVAVVTFLVSLAINLLDGEKPWTALAYAAVAAIVIIPIGVATAYCWIRDYFAHK